MFRVGSPPDKLQELVVSNMALTGLNVLAGLSEAYNLEFVYSLVQKIK